MKAPQLVLLTPLWGRWRCHVEVWRANFSHLWWGEDSILHSKAKLIGVKNGPEKASVMHRHKEMKGREQREKAAFNKKNRWLWERCTREAKGYHASSEPRYWQHQPSCCSHGNMSHTMTSDVRTRKGYLNIPTHRLIRRPSTMHNFEIGTMDGAGARAEKLRERQNETVSKLIVCSRLLRNRPLHVH